MVILSKELIVTVAERLLSSWESNVSYVACFPILRRQRMVYWMYSKLCSTSKKLFKI